jgi:triosephosphate isomerase (TIM)
MKRKALVVANWKMHGQRTWIDAFVQEFLQLLVAHQSVDVVLCPPAVYLMQLEALLNNGVAKSGVIKSGTVKLGAQNLYFEVQGAYTGEVSAQMLQDCGCSYVLVGHSERRVLFSETDALVATKFNAVRKSSALIPILCVGENAAERQAGLTEATIQRQIDAVLLQFGIEAFNNSVVAYEPVWAIGTGNTATPQQAQAVHEFVRGYLASYDRDVADRMSILYGGSVKADNAAVLAVEKDIDGALVGGASLVAREFGAICAGFAG